MLHESDRSRTFLCSCGLRWTSFQSGRMKYIRKPVGRVEERAYLVAGQCYIFGVTCGSHDGITAFLYKGCIICFSHLAFWLRDVFQSRSCYTPSTWAVAQKPRDRLAYTTSFHCWTGSAATLMAAECQRVKAISLKSFYKFYRVLEHGLIQSN
jgi:hypothetical protein